MKILIDEEICTRIEMLQYEVESRKEIITAYLNMNGVSNSNLFENYQKDYMECFISYNKAKKEMIDKYEVPSNSSWSLDFATRELTY